MAEEVISIDLHLHTTVSDGTDAPERIPEMARQAGLSLFSVTDHDAVKGCLTVLENLTEKDPLFTTGIEFSCADQMGKYHILGYGFDPCAEAILRLVAAAHQFRMNKLSSRLEYLRTEYGIVLSREERDSLLQLDNPGKPHLGHLLARRGYANNKDDAIKRLIDGCPFRNEYLSPEESIRGIIAAGGIPVLAHPAFGSGSQLITGEDMDRRLRRLMRCGLAGVEAFYAGFSQKLRDEMTAFADRYDLYITAGSDYHGSNKQAAVGDTGLKQCREYPGGLLRFIENVRKFR